MLSHDISKKGDGKSTSTKNRFYNRELFFQNKLSRANIRNALSSSMVQTKLKIGGVNDKFEQEADHVADKVMNVKDSELQNNSLPAQASPVANIIQRKCNNCEEERQKKPALIQRIEGNKHPQNLTKGEGLASTEIESGIQSLKNKGTSLPEHSRAFFEPRFGSDFSNVKIHTDNKAQALASSINARAFTFGNNIAFGSGEFQPKTDSGKHLMGHELTHVLQQSNGVTDTINRTPNSAPPPDPYLEGRAAHNHVASSANWARVQADAQAKCTSFTDISINCPCATLSPMNVLNTASAFVLTGIAQDNFDHYVSGGGADLLHHTNLDNMLAADDGARGVITAGIAVSDRGHVFIQQTDYTLPEFKNAFGGIDRVDYLVDRATGTVDVWFKDRYDFHPVGFGYALRPGPGDVLRNTNCVHAAAVELKRTNSAQDFWMKGHATVPLSLFAAAPPPSSPGDID